MLIYEKLWWQVTWTREEKHLIQWVIPEGKNILRKWGRPSEWQLVSYGLTEAPHIMTVWLRETTPELSEPDQSDRDQDHHDDNDNPTANVIKKALMTKRQTPRKSETRVIELGQQITPTRYLGWIERQAHLSSDLDSSDLSSESNSDVDNSFSPDNSDLDSLDASSLTLMSGTSSSSENIVTIISIIG